MYLRQVKHFLRFAPDSEKSKFNKLTKKLKYKNIIVDPKQFPTIQSLTAGARKRRRKRKHYEDEIVYIDPVPEVDYPDVSSDIRNQQIRNMISLRKKLPPHEKKKNNLKHTEFLQMMSQEPNKNVSNVFEVTAKVNNDVVTERVNNDLVDLVENDTEIEYVDPPVKYYPEVSKVVQNRQIKDLIKIKRIIDQQNNVKPLRRKPVPHEFLRLMGKETEQMDMNEDKEDSDMSAEDKSFEADEEFESEDDDNEDDDNEDDDNEDGDNDEVEDYDEDVYYEDADYENDRDIGNMLYDEMSKAGDASTHAIRSGRGGRTLTDYLKGI